MSIRLHTIGYEKRSLDEYLELLQDAGITVVVDVRQTAWSHKPGFSKGLFSAALERVGIRYVHAAFAGNPKSLRATARSHAECLDRYRGYLDERPEIVAEFDALLTDLAGEHVAITCFERHHEDCHRSILAGAWQQYDAARDVAHLYPDGCKRLLPV